MHADTNFIANSICEGASREMVKTDGADLLRMGAADSSISVIAASGPFTTNNNLDFEPLADLLAHVVTKKVDVVVLSGPFVGCHHPMVRDGMVQLEDEDGKKMSITFENVFSEKFSAMVEDCVREDGVKTQFVLVPSLEDSFHDTVFPQPPFAVPPFESS